MSAPVLPDAAALSEGARAQIVKLIALVADCKPVTEAELCHALGEASMRPALYDARRHLRRQGWYIFRVTARHLPGVFQLARADEAPAMLRDAPPESRALSRPVQVERRAPPVSAHVVAGRRTLTIPQAAEGCCQYMVIREGKPVPCGRKAAGVYCDEHRAVSAGVPYREGRYARG